MFTQVFDAEIGVFILRVDNTQQLVPEQLVYLHQFAYLHIVHRTGPEILHISFLHLLPFRNHVDDTYFQEVDVERFGNILVCPLSNAVDALAVFGQGCQQYDGDMAESKIILHPVNQLEPIHTGH